MKLKLKTVHNFDKKNKKNPEVKYIIIMARKSVIIFFIPSIINLYKLYTQLNKSFMADLARIPFL